MKILNNELCNDKVREKIEAAKKGNVAENFNLELNWQFLKSQFFAYAILGKNFDQAKRDNTV